MKKIFRKLFNWIFADEIKNLNILIYRIEEKEKLIDKTLHNFDISLDVRLDKYTPSWACFSLQGQKKDYVKFISLPDRDIEEIARFVSRFDKRYNKVKADLPYMMPKRFFEFRVDDNRSYDPK